MKWLSLFWLPLVAGCKIANFTKEDGMALKNHVIETVTVFQPVACHWQCVDSPLCFSVNIRKQLNGWVTCELNNSSKTADPQDLVPSIGSQYHQMKVSIKPSSSVMSISTIFLFGNTYIMEKEPWNILS